MKEKIKAFFEKNNWKYIDNGSVLKLDVDGDGITWYAFFKVDQTDNFCCFSVLPARISAKRIPTVMRLLNFINTRIWFGDFEIITDGTEVGQVRLRASAFVPVGCDEKTMNEIIENVVTYSGAVMNLYGNDIIKANFSDSDDIELFLSE